MKSVMLAGPDNASAILIILDEDDIESLLFGEQIHATHGDGPDTLIHYAESSHELDCIVESGTAQELLAYLEFQKPEQDYFLAERFRNYEPTEVNRIPEKTNTIVARRIEASVASETEDGDLFMAVGLKVDGLDADVVFQMHTPEKADRLIATLMQIRNNLWPQRG